MSDQRDPAVCPKCGEVCRYDGWDHVHATGLGIGSCVHEHSHIYDAATGLTSDCACGFNPLQRRYRA